MIGFVFGRGLSFGDKGSRDYLVKGSHKDFQQELVNELKAICQVFYQLPFHYKSEISHEIFCCCFSHSKTIFFLQYVKCFHFILCK